MEAKHTPGPWNVDLEGPFVLGGDSVSVDAVTADGKKVRREICTCMLDTDAYPKGKDWLEDAANARLIAAAPDLYAALIGLVKAGESITVPANQSIMPWIEALSAAGIAIAKAEGGDN